MANANRQSASVGVGKASGGGIKTGGFASGREGNRWPITQSAVHYEAIGQLGTTGGMKRHEFAKQHKFTDSSRLAPQKNNTSRAFKPTYLYGGVKEEDEGETLILV